MDNCEHEVPCKRALREPWCRPCLLDLVSQQNDLNERLNDENERLRGENDRLRKFMQRRTFDGERTELEVFDDTVHNEVRAVW